MANYRTVLALMLLGFVLISSKVHAASFGVQSAEEDSIKDLQTRNLLDEVDQLEEVEEELSRREEILELRRELAAIQQEDRKRQIRQTPVPEVKRLKMTPPPNVPETILRLKHTPIPPPSDIGFNPADPYNLANRPLRQTPKPLRITPQPFVRPAVYPMETVEEISNEQELAQELWNEINERFVLIDRRELEREAMERQELA